MKRAVLSMMFALFGCAVALHAQASAPSRQIFFETFRSIAERILPSDKWIVVMSGTPMPAVAHVPDDEFLSTIVRENPIIFTARIVEKRPVFMRLRAGEKFTEVSTAEANWIGSRITVMVDRIIQTVDKLPLMTLQRLTFVEEGDGTATISGVRVDTETPWLEPVQQGRRYLITGRIRDGEFSSTGLWMEAPDGASMRPRARDSSARSTADRPLALRIPKTPLDEATVDEAVNRLETEAQRQRTAR